MQIKAQSTDSLSSSLTAAPSVSDTASTIASTTDSDHLTLAITQDPEEKHILLSIVPPAVPSPKSTTEDAGSGMARAALDICCVIDVSGSMGTEALVPADPSTGAPAESTGLSVLDVVKHALRTIAATLQPDDRLGLVAFSGSARVVSTLTPMTDDGRAAVLDAVKSLYPSGSTNLWDGLKFGMDLLTGTIPSSKTAEKKVDKTTEKRKTGFSVFSKRSAKDDQTSKAATQESTSLGRSSALFILTDGMPNVNPPRGHIPMLQAYLDKLDNQNLFSISTFGFGYSLDTKLLLEIAQVGGGGYGFIPDSGIVGTVFVHAVANAFSTFASRARLDVEVPQGTTVQVKGNLPVTQTSWGVQIEVGDVQFGQSLDVVLVCNPMITNDIAATLTYRPVIAQDGTDRKAQATLLQSVHDLAAVRHHAARLEFVEILYSASVQKGLEKTAKELNELANKITTSPILGQYDAALALVKDITGEGTLALEAASFNRWGRHYLPSLARSHQRQQCGNFKDPGLQVYGRDSKLFKEERDKLDAAFMALPPPEPSIPPRQVYSSSTGTYKAAPRAKLKSMSRYYDSCGPCFAGDCIVEMGNGSLIPVEELRRGMKVRTLRGVGEVAAVVRTAVHGGSLEMCRIGELQVTAWHPIVLPGSTKWVFPADVVKAGKVACDAIYSVLLLPPTTGDEADAHSVLVGGVWCVTLGHGLTKRVGEAEDVRVHGFLGDYWRVVYDLARLIGFGNGEGVVHCVGTKRDRKGMICGFVGEAERADESSAPTARAVVCA